MAVAEGTRVARRAGTVAGFTLLSRILGYTRDAVMAHAFGAGVAFDAFVAAQTIPNVFRRLVAEGTLMIAFVPLLAQEEEQRGLPGMRRFASAVLGALLPLLVVLTALGMLFPGLLVDAFASGFDGERARLAERMTRIMMPFLFFVSLVAVAGGALNARGVFAPPAAAPVFLNLAIIGATLGATTWFDVPIEAAAWGVLAGGVLQLLLQIPFLAKAGLWVRPAWRPRDPSLRTLLVRMGPAVFGVGVYQLNLVVIRQIASFLPQGQLSCYFYATRLEEFALGVFAVSISIAALPTLSQHAARNDLSAFRRTLLGALRATNFITIPSMVGLFALALPIVSVLFQHGAFAAGDAELTARLVRVMAFALVPIGLVRVLVPAYYAVGDTRLPVGAAATSLAGTAIIGLALQGPLEIFGLTIATAVAAALQLTVLVVFFGRRVEQSLDGAGAGMAPSMTGLAAHAGRCLIAMAPAALLAGWVGARFDWVGQSLPLLVRIGILAGTVGACAASYFGFARLLGVPEGVRIAAAVRRRASRR
jgi:putative peptidoglycan lipid II flippase